MKHKKLSEAMEEIDDRYLEDAAGKKSFRLPITFAAWAAVFALIILCIPLIQRQEPGKFYSTDTAAGEQPIQETAAPESPQAIDLTYNVAAPQYPEMAPYPTDERDIAQTDAYFQSRREQYNQPKGYADSLTNFWKASIPAVLTGNDSKNTVYSPINVYMALSMLAETAGGDSRQQILDTLNAKSMDALRTQAGYVWNAHYCADGATTLLLGNSLWLDDTLLYNKETADILAEAYYASVYHGNLESPELSAALQNWLNDQTGGLLKDQIQNLAFEPDTLMALASTIRYKVKWLTSFDESLTAPGVFHTPGGDVTAEFMHSTISPGRYYYSDNFSAIRLSTEDYSHMWLILPDEGLTPQDLLDSGTVMDMIFSYDDSSDAYHEVSIRINLALPKFDIASDLDLKQTLLDLGIRDVFEEEKADFSGISPDSLYLSQVRHAGRVMIDEEGIDAAAYTVMAMCGAGMPPNDEIDFVLDRPFLFIIESSDGLPLFAGVVNNP